MCVPAALATEEPTPELLDEKPHGRNEQLINGRMWKHILVQVRVIPVYMILPSLSSFLRHKNSSTAVHRGTTMLMSIEC